MPVLADTSPPLQLWFDELHRNVEDAWDNPIVCTGEEGTWKSLWMRKAAKKFDPKFSIDHLHFKQEDFLEDVASLEPGRAVVLDEWRGHKRQAMHGFRMEILEWFKDNREQGITSFIGFPHVTQMEADLLFDRFRYWCYKPSRPRFRLRKRFSRGDAFDAKGQPVRAVKWRSLNGQHLADNYPMTGDNDPLRAEYQAKKKAHMREVALNRESKGHQLDIDDSAFDEAISFVKPLKGRRVA